MQGNNFSQYPEYNPNQQFNQNPLRPPQQFSQQPQMGGSHPQFYGNPPPPTPFYNSNPNMGNMGYGKDQGQQPPMGYPQGNMGIPQGMPMNGSGGGMTTINNIYNEDHSSRIKMGQGMNQPLLGHQQTTERVVIREIHIPEGHIQCGGCHHYIIPKHKHEPGAGTWCMCIACCFVAGCCGLLPFCIDDCQDTIQDCPNCGYIIKHDKFLL